MIGQLCSKERMHLDITKIVEAISSVSIDKEIKSIEEEIFRVLESELFNNNEDSFYRYMMYDRINMLLERKREYSFYRKLKNIQIRNALRDLWLSRNANACRSNTSMVSDPMMNTIPTPPTATAVKCSCGQRGITSAEKE